jgi:predicted nucleic acid-binding protein
VILGIDTDILVTWVMRGTPLHTAVRRFVEHEVHDRGGLLGLTPQVIQEFLHVVTDSRRFEHPLAMPEALRICRSLVSSREVQWILPSSEALPRTLDLLEKFNLGRKRILDTALAATLECAGVERLMTLNRRDYEVFPFLELVGPDIE